MIQPLSDIGVEAAAEALWKIDDEEGTVPFAEVSFGSRSALLNEARVAVSAYLEALPVQASQPETSSELAFSAWRREDGAVIPEGAAGIRAAFGAGWLRRGLASQPPEVDLAAISEALGLFASAIKSGEQRSERCREVQVRAHIALSRLQALRPEFYSFRSNAELGANGAEVLRLAAAKMREDGATFFRATQLEDGVWLEGWLVEPRPQPPFNPPYTYSEA